MELYKTHRAKLWRYVGGTAELLSLQAPEGTKKAVMRGRPTSEVLRDLHKPTTVTTEQTPRSLSVVLILLIKNNGLLTQNLFKRTSTPLWLIEH